MRSAVSDTTQDFFFKNGLKAGDKAVFSQFFRHYYKDLVIYAGRYIVDKQTCKDLVQNVFVKLWHDRDTIEIRESLKSYLLRSVINLCIDEIRHHKIKSTHDQRLIAIGELMEYEVENAVFYSELEKHYHKALEQLPEVIRATFEMSRTEGLKYHEIAEKMGVSVRTVEVRISKALLFLKEHLKEFISIIMIYLS